MQMKENIQSVCCLLLPTLVTMTTTTAKQAILTKAQEHNLGLHLFALLLTINHEDKRKKKEF